MNLKERNAQIELYLPLVRGAVTRLAGRLPPQVDRDDLYSAGVIGLVAAVEKYDASKGATLAGYASFRVRGAMLDELRRLDPTPRRIRTNARELEKARCAAETELGRLPTDTELADRLGITEEALERRQRETVVVMVPMDRERDGDRETGGGGPGSPGSLHELLADGAEGARDGMERREQLEALAELIAQLPPREKKILALYYTEGVTLAEIAMVFDLTPTRVCQIRQAAVATVRRRLAAAGEGAALRAA